MFACSAQADSGAWSRRESSQWAAVRWREGPVTALSSPLSSRSQNNVLLLNTTSPYTSPPLTMLKHAARKILIQSWNIYHYRILSRLTFSFFLFNIWYLYFIHILVSKTSSRNKRENLTWKWTLTSTQSRGTNWEKTKFLWKLADRLNLYLEWTISQNAQ